MFEKNYKIAQRFSVHERAVVFPGDCLDMLKDCPDGCLGLVVTSPPYNIGKEYEKRLKLDSYFLNLAPSQ